MIRNVFLFAIALGLFACSSKKEEEVSKVTFEIPYEKFVLDNGLNVIFHIDRSDPVLAVALTAHVGSAREKPGRTGFAHLFEHLLFLESENLGKGGLDKMSARIGGSGANGFTTNDQTNYYQTVPNDALEKMIWAEADKIGWFINTVSDPVLAKEKQVVKNEKRQSYDNRPYGHNWYVLSKNIYPKDHPYNWQVIGSLEDLQNTTLADVKEFFNRWYVPNNVTLVISGDFDPAEAKALVHKYFDEIPRGKEVVPMPKRAGEVKETIKLYHEDNFAQVPRLSMAWPTVALYNPDAYALNVLAQYLAVGKNAPFYQLLVEEKKLTSDVWMFQNSDELAGAYYLMLDAFQDEPLDKVAEAIDEAFLRFEKEGISKADLARIQAGLETEFYQGLSSVEDKAFQLAQYNMLTGDPGYIAKDIENMMAVTTEDVVRVYNTYIKGKNYVVTSFVPKGQLDLILTGSTKAEIVEELIVEGAEETFDASIEVEYEPTPSSFDRSQEPPYGPSPDVKVPEVWEASLDNGIEVYGIESSETPLIELSIVIKGGQLLENIDKPGVANITAQLMTKGTATKTPKELEEAIEQLGASISISAHKESIRITATTLARNYDAVMALITEMLLEPRWDAAELELIREATKSQIQQEMGDPNAMASNAYGLLIYGKDNIRSQNLLGNLESIATISMDDLQAFYQKLTPSLTSMHVVGGLDNNRLLAATDKLSKQWEAKEVALPKDTPLAVPEKSTIYFYDIPGAKQSVLRIGYPALAVTDADYYPAVVMNFILGGGGFASQLTQQLRETKGYTYGIYSTFSGSTTKGPFTIGSGVRSNVTLESTQLIKEILENYGKDYSENDLETTQSNLIKRNARSFETFSAKLNLLENMSSYGWSSDYVKQREEIVNNMSIEEIQRLSDKYLNANKMIWLVVGDGETQLERMNELGFGQPVLINDNKNPEM